MDGSMIGKIVGTAEQVMAEALPLAILVIPQIETACGPGTGEQKRVQAIEQILEEVHAPIPPALELIAANAVGLIVDLVVRHFKATGKLPASAPAPPPATDTAPADTAPEAPADAAAGN